MKKLKIGVLALVVMLLLVFAMPVAAVTDGELDGNAHPHVVLLLMEVNGQPAFRCSATMLTSTVVLTAGHCTGAPGEFSGMRIFTESDVHHGNNNYPFAGPNSVEAKAWYTHPLYSDAAFFLHDVGVVILAKPFNPGVFGKLPGANSLDTLQPRASTLFTSVGYGRQESYPNQAMFLANNQRIRMVANPHLVQINAPGMTGDFSLLLSNNAATGGTCFGDSGGPNFLGNSNVVAGVTSFGLNSTCGGTGGVFRMDRQNVLDFVKQFLKK